MPIILFCRLTDGKKAACLLSILIRHALMMDDDEFRTSEHLLVLSYCIKSLLMIDKDKSFIAEMISFDEMLHLLRYVLLSVLSLFTFTERIAI